VAAILSVVETCRRHNIPIRHYLSSVLPGLGEFPANRVSELTPANWAPVLYEQAPEITLGDTSRKGI